MALPANIEQAKQSSQQATQRVGELTSYGHTVPDVLRQKVQDALNYSQDIIGPLDTATSQYISAPATAREKYQDIWNPFQRESLASQYTANQAIPMLALSSILGQRFGTVEDFLGAGTRAYQAQTGAATSAAELARQEYQDLLGEYQLEKSLEQQLWERGITEKELALKGTGTTEKYPFNEITMGAGIAGMPVTPENNEKLRRYGEYLQEQEITPSPTAASMGAAGYKYSPVTGKWEEQAPAWKRALNALLPKEWEIQ
jgi:hypothetical protein